MDWKKIGIGALVAILLCATLFLTGCTGYSEEELNAAVTAKVNELNTKHEKALNDAVDKATSEAKKDVETQINDAKTEVEKQKQTEIDKEKAEKEALAAELEALKQVEQEQVEQEQKEEAAYKIDDVELTGNFADVIDSDDYEKLKFYEVRFDGENYDVEEIVVVSSDVKPVYNIDDMNAEIFLEVEAEGAIEYRVEFPEAIDFTEVNEDEDDELELSFLGEDVVVSKYADGELTFYSGTDKFIKVGETFTVGSLTVELISVAYPGPSSLLRTSDTFTSTSEIIFVFPS
jgi:hypothetical protein